MSPSTPVDIILQFDFSHTKKEFNARGDERCTMSLTAKRRSRCPQRCEKNDELNQPSQLPRARRLLRSASHAPHAWNMLTKVEEIDREACCQH